MKKHREISTYFRLKHHCGKEVRHFPYNVFKQKPCDYPLCLMSSDDIFQNLLFQKVLSGTLSECQTGLDPGQDKHFVGPDLGPICLQRLSANSKSRH